MSNTRTHKLCGSQKMIKETGEVVTIKQVFEYKEGEKYGGGVYEGQPCTLLRVEDKNGKLFNIEAPKLEL